MGKTHDCFGQFCLPVSLDSGNTDNFSRMNGEGDIVDHFGTGGINHREVIDNECSRAFFGWLLVHLELNSTANHHLCQFCIRCSGFCFTNNFSETDNRNGVSDSTYLTEFVGNENNGGSAIAKLTHDFHQFISFLRGKNSGGFIKNENLSIPGQRFNNFYTLLNTDRKISHNGIRVNIKPKARTDFLHKFPGSGKVQSATALCLLVTKHHIFCHREDRDQHKVLVDHADTGCHGIARPREMLNNIIEKNLSLVSLVETKQNVHQR